MMFVSSIAMASMMAQPPQAVPQPLPRPPIITQPLPRPAPPPLPDPSPEARQLALSMLERINIFEQDMRRMVTNGLRRYGPGGSCDFSNAECARIAEEIAARETPRLVQNLRENFGRLLGAQFDRKMSPAQIAEARRFFAKGAGPAMIESVISIDQKALAALEPAIRPITPQQREELAEEFARRTRHLPRAAPPMTPMIVPLPPAPPPPRPRG